MDIFNIPNFNESNKIFFPNGTSWQIWNKPSGIKFVYFYLVGGGGSGGGGRTGALNSGGGGGGGGSGGYTVCMFPAFILPDILYVQAGAGGLGVAAGTIGNSGALSYVSVEPNTTAINILIQSGTAAAGGGGAGTNSGNGAGAGGLGSTAWTTSQNLTILSISSSTAGQAGALGGTNIPAAGSSITLAKIFSGGAGGGGCSNSGVISNGGSINGVGFIQTIGGGTSTTKDGSTGYAQFNPTSESFSDEPLFFTGGSGGASTGSTPASIGGAGGNGAFGSGGGGGGASYGSTGGRGGKGGDGFILIVSV